MTFRHLTGNPLVPTVFLNKDDGTGSGGDPGKGDDGKGAGDAGTGKPDPKADTGDGGTGGEGGTETGKTYTQAEVDKQTKKTTNWAEKQGRAKLLEELGIDDPEALKSLVEAEKQRKENELSDQQKATAAAEKAKAEADVARSEALAEKVKAQLERALLRPGDDAEAEPGLNAEFMEGAMAVALPHALASDDPDSAIADAVAHARATVPVLFGTPAGGGKPPPGTSGTPGRTNGQRTTNKSGAKTDGGDAIKAWQKDQKGRMSPLPGQSTTD